MRSSLLLAAALGAAAACAGVPEGTARVELDLPDQAAHLADRTATSAKLHGDDLLTIRLLRVTAPIALHANRESEVALYVISGEGVLHVNGDDRPLRAGDLAVIPRATPHGFTPTGKEPVVVLQLFTPRQVEDDAQGESDAPR